MNHNFTLDLASDMFNLELRAAKNGMDVHLFTEFYYSEECPSFDFRRCLTAAEAGRITPENAAALLGQIAAYAVQDITAEANYEKQVADLINAGMDPADIPGYPTQIDHKMRSFMDVFCYGGAYGEACED